MALRWAASLGGSRRLKLGAPDVGDTTHLQTAVGHTLRLSLPAQHPSGLAKLHDLRSPDVLDGLCAMEVADCHLAVASRVSSLGW